MTLENISLCENGNIELCDNGNISFCTVLVELTHCNNLAHSSCDGSEASIITELEASHVGKVVRIGGVCYSVATVESGTPVAVTVDKVYDDCAECCGDLAPCTCPCEGTWPPASWPCGGLVEVYTLAEGSYIELVDSGVSYRWQATIAVALTATSSCSWTSNLSETNTQLYIDGTPTGPEFVGRWEVFLLDCQWELYQQIGLTDFVPKTTGQSPAGHYQSRQSGDFQINTNASIS